MKYNYKENYTLSDNKIITISLCLIVKNEEKVLENCLNSVKDIVDEIIIVDTGSTDNTKIIAEKYNAKIYDFKWCNDFSKARNYSFSLATKDYIFWLDADDILPEKYLNNFKNLKYSIDKSIDAVSMIYSRMRNEKDETTFSLRRYRLVKRDNKFKWIGKIHEYLDVYGNTVHSDIEIYHKKEITIPCTRNLDIFLEMKNNNEQFTNRDIFYFANELFDNHKYEEAIEQYKLFLNKNDIWVEDRKSAYFNLYKCYYQLSKSSEILPLLFNSFLYDTPRADICCGIANTFFEEGKFKEAIFWYKVALSCKPDKTNMGFNFKDFYTFIPAIQLCVCYCEIGDYEQALYYNEIASLSEGTSDKTEHNKRYITKKLAELNLPLPIL